jgi:hypothetical protein
MAGGLAWIGQDDVAAGMVRSVARHLIPSNGCYDLLEFLLDDDGSAYERGGSVYKSAAHAQFLTGLRNLWDVRVTAGQRTVFTGDSGVGTLASNDTSVVVLSNTGIPGPVGAAVLGGALFIGGGVVYGGSRKAADYSTGTVSVTQGSASVTGSGTSWSANVDAGMLLSVAGGEVYVVQSVGGNTALTLDRPYLGATAAAQAYTLKRLGTAAVVAPVYVAGGNRLIACSGNQIRVSDRQFAADGVDPRNGALQYGSFTEAAMQLPDGVDILGGGMARDLLLTFATEGVWAVTNIGLDLLDDFGNVQRRMDKITGDVVLWGQSGIASWQNALVVPTLDGVVLVDGVSAPTPVGRAITPLIAEYVKAGYQPGGGVVFRNHYFLPVLDASNVVVDLLVCRLDRPTRSRLGTIFPWSHAGGHGGAVTALAQRVGGQGAARQPDLLAAGQDGRVLSLARFFTPDGDVKVDADGSAVEALLETRDYATGPGNLNQAKRLKVRYELEDAASDAPVITARMSKGAPQPGIPFWGLVDWGLFDWTDPRLAEYVTLVGDAPVSTGRDPFVWSFAARTRFIRFRLECVDPTAKLVVRSIQVGVLQSESDR